MANTILLILTLIAGGVFLFIVYMRNKNQISDISRDKVLTFEQLLDIVKHELADHIKDNSYLTILSNRDWKAARKRRAALAAAMNDCVYGIDSAKIIVQGMVKDCIRKYLKTRDDILAIVPFESRFLEDNVKLEILLTYYKKIKGRDALPYLIDKHKLAEPKYEIEDKKKPSYVITSEDLDYVYRTENIELTDDLMLDVLTVLLYQKYKGFGCIDTIREMNIDGINTGVSGSILYAIGGGGIDAGNVSKALNSIWVQYSARYIHFKFLSFGTEGEARRVTQLVARCGNPGPLTEKVGYRITTMYDKSRVLAFRPDAGEYWALFIRKFSVSNISLPALANPTIIVKDDYGKPILDKDGNEIRMSKYKNTHLPEKTIAYLMNGRVTTGFTGRQSSGKTTWLKSAISEIDPMLNIRILETAPEMYAREIYPDRNIFSVSETNNLAASVLQNALKKSDAAVSMVGEVATPDMGAHMIEFGMVASLFTLFSHHAITTEDLVDHLTQNVMTMYPGMPASIAQSLVLKVLKVDVHLDFDENGNRFVERITEIRPRSRYSDYAKYDHTKTMEMNRFELDREYYTRMTDRKLFDTVDIVVFNKETFTYEVRDWFSDSLSKHMLSEIPKYKKSEFKQFVRENWG